MALSEAERDRRRQAATATQRRRRRIAALGAIAVVGVLGALVALRDGSSSPSRAGGSSSSVASGTRSVPGAAAPTSPRTRRAAGSRAVLPAIGPPVPGAAHVTLQGPARPQVALTIDDGFCPRCVARIIGFLERTGAHATIFPNGVYASSWQPQAAAIRRLLAAGQLTVGNHTFLHHDAVLESSSAFRADLARDESWIEKTFGVTARPYFRPPYGAYNASTLDVAGQLGFTKVVNWSGTVADSSPRSIPYILHAIRYWAKPGAIILMHGNYPNTSIALPRILAILKARGLQPVTLKELLG